MPCTAHIRSRSLEADHPSTVCLRLGSEFSSCLTRTSFVPLCLPDLLLLLLSFLLLSFPVDVVLVVDAVLMVDVVLVVDVLIVVVLIVDVVLSIVIFNLFSFAGCRVHIGRCYGGHDGRHGNLGSNRT